MNQFIDFDYDVCVKSVKHCSSTVNQSQYIMVYIVACHLSEGSWFQWREDIGGGLTTVDFPQCKRSLQPA